MALRPTIGRGTAVTRVRVQDGLACGIEEGRWRLAADLSEKAGGTGSAPDPGVFGRAALGSCLAIGYAVWAAKLEVPVSSIEVEVRADYDNAGYYGVAGMPAGYTRIVYVVTIESEAPRREILRLLDEADRHSPYLDVFRRPMDVSREVRVTAPGEAL